MRAAASIVVVVGAFSIPPGVVIVYIPVSIIYATNAFEKWPTKKILRPVAGLIIGSGKDFNFFTYYNSIFSVFCGFSSIGSVVHSYKFGITACEKDDRKRNSRDDQNFFHKTLLMDGSVNIRASFRRAQPPAREITRADTRVIGTIVINFNPGTHN